MGDLGTLTEEGALARSLKSGALFLTLEKEGRLSRSGVMGELEAQCPELSVRAGEIQVGPGRYGEPRGPSVDS